MWMFSVEDPSSRLLRWRLLLEEFHYTIEYKAGKKNVNADALSRNPVVLTTMIASKEKQQKILQEMHECPIGGHQGVQRTYHRLKLYVTCPGMYRDVENYVTNCKICQKNKFAVPYFRAPFQETDTQLHPWVKLYLDIVGPLPIIEEDYKYVGCSESNAPHFFSHSRMKIAT